MTAKTALGVVVSNRWDLTQKTLQSLYHTDQAKSSYDFYIISTGSDPSVVAELKLWAQSGLVPVKNLLITGPLGIGPAWNLFLNISKDYPLRTKLDNDLIFANTPVSDKPFERVKKVAPQNTPGNAGVNPGAIPTASIVMGAGHKIEKKAGQIHTCFLEYLEDTMVKSKLGVCALPPVDVGSTLMETLPALGELRWRDHPVLVGGCMTIDKSTFEKLGYFDEKLPCHIDWEYSQRAMAHGINVGYTSDYCVIHFGKNNPTLTPDQIQQNELFAKNLVSEVEFKREYVETKWEKVHKKIATAANKNMIVNLS